MVDKRSGRRLNALNLELPEFSSNAKRVVHNADGNKAKTIPQIDSLPGQHCVADQDIPDLNEKDNKVHNKDHGVPSRDETAQ